MLVRVLSPGNSAIDFNLFVESENRLLIERIHQPLKVIDSGSTIPDWIKAEDQEADKTVP